MLVNISEAKSSLSKLIERVRRGERVIIGKAGEPVAVLIPYASDPSPRKLGGSWEHHVEVSQDFDDIPDCFAPYVEDEQS